MNVGRVVRHSRTLRERWVGERRGGRACTRSAATPSFLKKDEECEGVSV